VGSPRRKDVVHVPFSRPVIDEDAVYTTSNPNEGQGYVNKQDCTIQGAPAERVLLLNHALLVRQYRPVSLLCAAEPHPLRQLTVRNLAPASWSNFVFGLYAPEVEPRCQGHPAVLQ